MREEVVWWSDTGATLHQDYNCPPFVRARIRAIAAAAAGDFEGAATIHSYDFRNDSALNEKYPPTRLRLCLFCRSRRP